MITERMGWTRAGLEVIQEELLLALKKLLP